MTGSYLDIARHYEACLEAHGDTPKGVDWPDPTHVDLRYRTMLEIVRAGETNVSLLDFGCGTGHLLDYIQRYDIAGIRYSGLDISKKFVAVAQAKYPAVKFYCLDILRGAESLPVFDYVVMNGVLTEKLGLEYHDMFSFMKKLLPVVFTKANMGLAFNVMSKHVDWERADLFHVPFDELAAYLKAEISRNIVFRADYGLYEYTVYVYRQPADGKWQKK
jgi:SAM-dependent methyltransferase